MGNIISDLGYGAAGAWRNYNTSGVPSSGAHEPAKSEIQAFIDAIANTVGADSLLNYGAKADGTTDCAPALDAAVAACVANGTRFLRLPSTSDGQVYRFASEPAKINAGIAILGDGIERTIIHKEYVGSSSTRGLFHCDSFSSLKLGGMSIVAQSGAKTGAAISLMASGPGQEPGWSGLEELYMSSGPIDGWDYCIYFDGSANTGAAIGNRDLGFRRIYAFGAKERSVYLKSPFIFNWFGGIVTADTGSGTADGSLEIDGTSSAPATDLNIALEAIGDLRLSNYINSGNIHFGICDRLFNNINCSGVLTSGRVFTSCENNWPTSGPNTSRHIDTALNVGSNGTGSWREMGAGSGIYIQLMTVTVTSSFQTFNFPTPFTTPLYVSPIMLGLNGSDAAVIQGTLNASSVQLACSSARTGTQVRVAAVGLIDRNDLP